MTTTDWVMVPREPTEEMVAAGRRYAVPATQAIIPIYTAMLSASPPPVSLEEIVEVLETALVWMPIGFAPTLGIAPADTHNARAGVARERVRSLLSRLTSMGETK